MTTKRINRITEDDYNFVEKPDSLMYSVKIKKGKYKDVIVTYGKVGIKTNEDGNGATLSFQFVINESPKKHNKKKLEKTPEFKNLLGDILSHIIQNALDTGKYKLGSQEKSNGIEPTINDFTEADQ